jgi:hypothetical protein
MIHIGAMMVMWMLLVWRMLVVLGVMVRMLVLSVSV